MQTDGWHRLFLPFEDSTAAAAALRDVLTARGYRLYDPFPGGTGLSFGWQRRIRHFVAPPAGGWTAVLGEPDRESLAALSAALDVPLLAVSLADSGGSIMTWSAEGPLDQWEGLRPWLRDGVTPEQLAGALAGRLDVADEQPDEPQVLAVPLPPEMRRLADSVNPAEAERLMARLTKSVFGKLEGDAPGAQADARQMLSGGAAVWNTPEGKRLRAVMGCLRMPENWRKPVFADLSAAYQVARSRQVNPDGLRLPGDDEALARVPDALAFIPVYAGLR